DDVGRAGRHGWRLDGRRRLPRSDDVDGLADRDLLDVGARGHAHGVTVAGDIHAVLDRGARRARIAAVVEGVVARGGDEARRRETGSTRVGHVVEEESLTRIPLGRPADAEEEGVDGRRVGRELEGLIVREEVLPRRPDVRRPSVDAHPYDVVRLAVIELHLDVDPVPGRPVEIGGDGLEDEALPLEVLAATALEDVRRLPVVEET